MNYDATNIAATYDLARDHGPAFLDLWMQTISSYLKGKSVKSILDLGCGTGRFSEALADYFNAQVIGVDPSTKMLNQALNKQTDSRVRYQIGPGEAIPLPDTSVDLVFMSMCFHHFEHPSQVAVECRRVLRESGTVFLRAGSSDQIDSYPYIDYFPTSRPILERSLQPCAFMRTVFETAGFQTVDQTLIRQQIAPSLEQYAEKIAAGADSVLAQLKVGEFEAGLNALRSHAARSENQSVIEPIDVLVFKK
jgi:ubiquinone/menaquinone biosynthesis C-methylase UbiE